MLADPERRKAGPPRRYLLSGLARCAVCGARVYGVGERSKGALYRCETRRHVNRSAEEVDDFLERVVLARLARPDAAELLAPPASGADVRGLREEEQALRDRLDGLAEAFAAGEIDRSQLRRGTERLRGQLDDVTARLSQSARAPVIAPLLAAEDVEETWHRLDVDRRRAVLALLLDVRLHPPGRGARRFDPASVDVVWRAA